MSPEKPENMKSEAFMFSGTRPEFVHLTEAEVWAAIAKNDENPIACEVTRLICCFWKRFRDCTQKHENMPPHVLHVSVRCPIERVAVMMLIGFVESETGVSGSVTRH